MNMKPSERIQQIHKELIHLDPIGELLNIGGPSDAALKAIIKYLDEQAEKDSNE